jgi:alkanesulfonate monooxygenase SsuD/methylene tetrahydromethanopterin reductase-like flavin-dependent oxidoreductase (luciferase family)
VFTTPTSTDDARALVRIVRDHEASESRSRPPLKVFADIVVFLDKQVARAQERKNRLDETFGHPYRSDALIWVGTPSDLANLLLEWQSAGITGFRLRPGAIPHDLSAITCDLVTELQARAAFRTHYEESTLRARLELPRSPSIYAST